MRTCDRCLFNGAFLTTTCTRCVKERRQYTERFTREYVEAKIEFERLQRLFNDVCWYNFEVSKWGERKPWVYLNSHNYKPVFVGSVREVACFPWYYQGTPEEAPRLPPEIVQLEVEKAHRYMLECLELVNAPVDWAPGGRKYEALRRVTRVGVSSDKFSSC